MVFFGVPVVLLRVAGFDWVVFLRVVLLRVPPDDPFGDVFPFVVVFLVVGLDDFLRGFRGVGLGALGAEVRGTIETIPVTRFLDSSSNTDLPAEERLRRTASPKRIDLGAVFEKVTLARRSAVPTADPASKIPSPDFHARTPFPYLP